MRGTTRYNRLLQRRAPGEDRTLRFFSESFEGESGDNTRYLLGAMRAMDPAYTQKLVEQGDRIQNQLTRGLGGLYPGMNYRRQGSVSNGTHIRYFSDVDLLTIIDKYFALQSPQVPAIPYRGNPIDDLTCLRQRCVTHLSAAFPRAELDDTGSTALKISGGSLYCSVDVVPANWYDSLAYSQSGLEHDRGVEVLDRRSGRRNENFPFLFNFRLAQQDLVRNGLSRMFIRLLKTLKADSREDGVEISLSSFDICSLVYRMPDAYVMQGLNAPFDLLQNLLYWMEAVIAQATLQSSLKVIDDTRVIFDEQSKVIGLSTLRQDLSGVYHSAIAEQASGGYLTESHYR